MADPRQKQPAMTSRVCGATLLFLCATGGSVALAEEGNGRSETSRRETLTLKTDLVPGPVDVAVLLPPGYQADATPYTLLLWLHGGPGDCSYLDRELRPVIEAAWKRKELGPLVVATPSARRSFYMDYQDGSEKWETLILKQLIPTLRQKYNLRDDQKGTLIGGYSMGGMGSLRMAFKHPERFGAVAAIAPAIEPAYQFKDIQPRDREYRTDAIFERTYGKPVDHDFWQANHPPTLARDRAGQIKDSKLKVYFEVGDADELGLFRGGEFLHDTLLQKNVSHEYRLVHGAKHEDESLPARLADAVRFLGRVSGGVDSQAAREVRAHLKRYLALFNKEQSREISQETFEAPVLIRKFGDERPVIAQTREDVQKQFETIFQKIKSQGWKRSVINGLTIHPAGRDLVIADWSFSRLQADGKAILPKNRNSTLTLVKRNGKWRIISVLLYPAPEQAPDPSWAREVRARMERYLELLNQQNVAAIATEIYQVPLLARGLAKTAQTAVMTEAVARDRLTAVMSTLKAKGWVRFTSRHLNVRVVNSDLALVSLVSERVRKDGSTIPPGRTPFTYAWIKHGNQWRMISVLSHGLRLDDLLRRGGKEDSDLRLDWLTGRWQGVVGDGVLEESWLPPKANSLSAVVRLTNDGKTEFVEMIKMEKVGDTLELRLRIFDSELNPRRAEPLVHRAIAQGKHSITFRGVSPMAHRTLHYELVAPGRFVIRLETHDGRKTEINLTRPTK